MNPTNINLGSYLYGEAIPVKTTIYLDKNSLLLLGLVLFIAFFGALFLNKKI